MKLLYGQQIFGLQKFGGISRSDRRGHRWFSLMFFGDKTPIYWVGMFISLAVIIIFLLIGIRTFRKMEKSFADLI